MNKKQTEEIRNKFIKESMSLLAKGRGVIVEKGERYAIINYDSDKILFTISDCTRMPLGFKYDTTKSKIISSDNAKRMILEKLEPEIQKAIKEKDKELREQRQYGRKEKMVAETTEKLLEWIKKGKEG